MEIQTSLLNREVIVYRRDNFTKVGILRSISDRFIVLEYSSGRQEILGADTIISIKLVREERI